MIVEELTQATAPIFPHTWEAPFENGGTITITNLGLTKREYFAGLALQGILTSHYPIEDNSFISEQAVALSDALLPELEK